MEKINSEKYYSPRAIAKLNILPWVSALTFARKLNEPKWREIFNPIIEEINGKSKVYVKGENIIKFMTLAKEGKLN